MLEKTKPEFVVALGHHAAMPAAFRFLVESGTPFLMEKPWGSRGCCRRPKRAAAR